MATYGMAALSNDSTYLIVTRNNKNETPSLYLSRQLR